MFDIATAVSQITPQVVQWRHQIHSHPELAFHEFKTSALVEKVLRDAGIEVIRYPNSTAVVGILKGGKPGKVVALRADMDALPIQEEVDLPFKSTVPNVMHACGHDMHTSILMGVASVLAAHREEVPGTVKFFFQPAEELPPGGAKPMVESGVMKNPDVDHAFGLHVGSNLETGKIKVNYGFSSANTDFANIKIIGKGGHGASPEKTVDAVVVAAQVVVAMQSIVSRNVAALDSSVVTIGSFNSGTVNNIIAETAELKLTIRTLKPEIRTQMHDRIEAILKGVCEAMGARYELDYIFGYPSLPNDENAADMVKRAAERVVGAENVSINTVASMGGEDFAYFAQEAPSAFFRLGAMVEAEDERYPGHNPKFKINEDCIPIGLEVMCNVVFEASK